MFHKTQLCHMRHTLDVLMSVESVETDPSPVGSVETDETAVVSVEAGVTTVGTTVDQLDVS